MYRSRCSVVWKSGSSLAASIVNALPHCCFQVRLRLAACPLKRPNLLKCRRFSHIRKQRRRDRAGWLGRQDSNLGMAESKSTCFAFDFKDHSKKSTKFDPFPINRLDADSECAGGPAR